MTLRKDHLDGVAISLLLACCLFWGFQNVLLKATVGHAPPVFQASVRFIGATLLLWGWCQWRGIALFSRDGSLKAGLLAGALFAAEFVFIYLGVQNTTASRLTVFLYTSPFWVAGLVPLFVPTERMRPVQWAGLACAFAAVVFALRDGLVSGGGERQWMGDLMALAAGMFWGLTTVVIRASSLTRVSPEKLLFYQVAVSAVVLPALSFQMGERWTLSLGSFAWISLAIQTLIGAFVSYLAWMWMLGRYPVTRVSVFVFLTPIFALLFGALWLGETITLSLVAALVLVAVGIVLVNRR